MTKQEYTPEQKARRAAYNRAYRAANRDKWTAYNRAWYAANPEKHAAYVRAYRAANPEKVAVSYRAWKVANPDRVTAIRARRRAAQLQRTPPWADHEWINHAYFVAADMAAKTGESWHVDHIIPLQGELVSGLHVYENLQILTASENCRKHNRFNSADTL